MSEVVLILGGIPENYNDKSLSDFVQSTQSHACLWTNVPISSTNGKAKGYAFVAFSNEKIATSAMEALKNKKINESTTLSARIAKARDMKKCTHASSSQRVSSRDGDRRRSDSDRHHRDRSPRERSRDRDRRSRRRERDGDKHRSDRSRDRDRDRDRDRHHRSSSRRSRSRSRDRPSSSAPPSGPPPGGPPGVPLGGPPGGPPPSLHPPPHNPYNTGIPGLSQPLPPHYQQPGMVPNVPNSMMGMNFQAMQRQAMSLTHSQNFQGMNSQKQDKINRELHVGNTNPAIRPDQLENFLNAAMIQGGLVTSPGPCIREVRCSGKFAFVELRTQEEANNAMNLIGIILMGRPLRIARARNYTGPDVTVTPWPTWMAKKIQENPKLQGKVIGMPDPNNPVAGSVGQSANGTTHNSTTPVERAVRELYVGNTPGFVTEALLANFIGAACVQVKISPENPVTNVRLNGKFCFVEFKTPEIANKALHLNQIEFGGNNLRVSRPSSYHGPAMHQVTWNELLAHGIDAVLQGASGMPDTGGGGMGGIDLGLGGIGGIVVQRPVTRCVQLSNMVQQEDLDTDEMYQDLTDDVTGEMAKYAIAAGGDVAKVHIPKGIIADDTTGSVGNIYVEFTTLEAAVKAFMDLPTRKFGEAYIKAVYYSEDKMSKEEYIDIIKFEEENKSVLNAATASAAAAVTAAALGTVPQPLLAHQLIPPSVGVNHSYGRGMQTDTSGTYKPAPGAAVSHVTGEVQILGGSGAPVGRGRGRGRTLPAWMTAQGQ